MGTDIFYQEVPIGDEWTALTANQRRDWAVRMIHAALTSMLNDRREPDEWEADALAYAITCLSSGYFNASVTSVGIALVPVAERQHQFVPRFPVLPREALFSALVHAQAVAVQDNER